MKKKTIEQFNKFGKEVPYYFRRNEIPKNFIGYEKTKKLKLNIKEEDFIAVYRTKAKDKNMYLLYDVSKVIDKNQMIESITKGLLTENQIKKFHYNCKENEKYYYIDGDNSQLFYDKTKQQKDLPKITKKDHLIGWFIEPILDLLNIPLQDKKPEAIFSNCGLDRPLPIYDMSETPFKDIEVFFNAYYYYDGHHPFNQKKEGKTLLSSQEIDLLNQFHPEKIEKNIPRLIEVAIPNGTKEETVKYIFYYDVSNHPLFRVKRITDVNFNASICLNNIMKKKNKA